MTTIPTNYRCDRCGILEKEKDPIKGLNDDRFCSFCVGIVDECAEYQHRKHGTPRAETIAKLWPPGARKAWSEREGECGI